MQWLGLQKQLHVYFLFLTQLFALSNIANSGDVIKMRNRKGSKYYILEAINKRVHHSYIFDKSIKIRNKNHKVFSTWFSSHFKQHRKSYMTFCNSFSCIWHDLWCSILVFSSRGNVFSYPCREWLGLDSLWLEKNDTLIINGKTSYYKDKNILHINLKNRFLPEPWFWHFLNGHSL